MAALADRPLGLRRKEHNLSNLPMPLAAPHNTHNQFVLGGFRRLSELNFQPGSRIGKLCVGAQIELLPLKLTDSREANLRGPLTSRRAAKRAEFIYSLQLGLELQFKLNCSSSSSSSSTSLETKAAKRLPSLLALIRSRRLQTAASIIALASLVAR